MNLPHEKDWLTAPELARQAGVSENTARRWIKQHELGRKVGGRWRAEVSRAAEFAIGDPDRSAGDPSKGMSISANE